MKYATNETVRLDWRGNDGNATISTYDDGSSTRTLDGFDTLAVLEFGLEPRTETALVEFMTDDLGMGTEEARARFDRLVDDGLLLPSDHPLPAESAAWFEKKWRAALYYHFGTRDVDAGAVRQPTDGLADDLLEPASEAVDGEVFALPEPGPALDGPVNEAMLRRRTHRSFRGESLDADRLSTLLHHGFEKVRLARERLADADEPPAHAEVAAAVPVEPYVLVMRSDDLDVGVYRYDVREHELVRVRPIDSPEAADDAVFRSATDQEHPHGAAATVLFSARFDREQARYRDSRALRNLYVQTAVQGHRVILTAMAMNLRAFLTPALRDSFVDDLVDADGFAESPTYLVSVGR